MSKFQEVLARARRARLKPKAPRVPAASTDGAQAYRDGCALKANPFPLGDPDNAIWRADWIEARGRAWDDAR